jgi:hypothetical protein
MQKSFFRAKQPGPCRAQKKSPAQALCLAGAGTKRKAGASDVWPVPGTKKESGANDAWPGT